MPYDFLPLKATRPVITGKSADTVAMGDTVSVTYTGTVTHAVIASPAAITHQASPLGQGRAVAGCTVRNQVLVLCSYTHADSHTCQNVVNMSCTWDIISMQRSGTNDHTSPHILLSTHNADPHEPAAPEAGDQRQRGRLHHGHNAPAWRPGGPCWLVRRVV